MSSYLQNQASAFRSQLSAQASKFTPKRPVGPQVPKTTPSPTPSQASAPPNQKRPEPSGTTVYSQPADTGHGLHLLTQISYAVDYLKEKDAPQKFDDIINYLSLQYSDNYKKQQIRTIFRTHEKVDFDPRGFGGLGAYSYRPTFNIKDGEQLIAYLQSQPTAQGLSVKELRDGWPDAEATIDRLEAQHRLLVTRNKKDNNPRMLWLDDPTLETKIDAEFQDMWVKVALPDPKKLEADLEKVGLTPTNKNRVVKAKPKTVEKKTRKQRKGQKTTNTHMASILRDYSGMRK